MRQGSPLAYLIPTGWGGKREGKMEGDRDLLLSGAESFLLGTIFFFVVEDNHEEMDEVTCGWGCMSVSMPY